MNDDAPVLSEQCDSAFGTAFLSYVLNIRVDQVPELVAGQVQLNSGQLMTLVLLNQLIEADLPQVSTGNDRSEVLKAIVSQADDRGVPVARRLHLQSGGGTPSASGTNTLGQAMARIAVDVFPLYLLPADERYPLPGFLIHSPIATGAVFRHPGRRQFLAALAADPKLGELFPVTDDDMIGASAWAWRNTGSGNSIQAGMLPELIFSWAWFHLDKNNPSEADFVEGSLRRTRLLTNLLDKKKLGVESRYALTGILLPDGVDEVTFADTLLTPTSDRDRELAPESLKGQLTGTDADGNSNVINYDGDVVCHMTFPLKIKTKTEAPEGLPAWPEEMKYPDSIERTLSMLRMSIVFAVPRDHRVQLLPTWRFVDDPLSYSSGVSWSDPKQKVGIMPTKLTNKEVEAWVEWYSLLLKSDISRIDVAVTRILKAISERREPSDVLIDSVIAWENLFGTSEGEPTLRVTASLALLLEKDLDERKKLRDKLKTIYTLRSGVVHGSKSLKQDQFPLCQEALDVALRAVKVLVEDRQDVLVLPDGAARSLHLIMGA